MPIISVVVPYYNTPRVRLRKCIESILEQTFTDFELLLIDDGNASGFEQIEKDYADADPRIHFLHKKHSGVSAARNYGIEHARGKYLSLLDADDFIDPTFLSQLYFAIQDSDLAICGVDEQFFPVDHGRFDKRIFFSLPDNFNNLQYVNFSVNKLYKLEIINQRHLAFDEGIKLGEDALFIDKYLSFCEAIRCVGNRSYHYVPNQLSAVHRYEPEYWNWEKMVIAKQWDRFHSYPLTEYQEHYMIRWLYIKLKGAMNYYIEHASTLAEKREKLQEIIHDNSFRQLMNGDTTKSNYHLNRNDRIILGLWKKLGIRGVVLAKMITSITKRYG